MRLPRSPLRCRNSRACFRWSCKGGEYFARRQQPATLSWVLRSWFTERFLHDGYELVNAKGFLDARSSALRKQGLRLAVGCVAADQYDAITQFRPMRLNPCVYVRAIYRPWHSNVGDDACKGTASQLLQAGRP